MHELPLAFSTYMGIIFFIVSTWRLDFILHSRNTNKTSVGAHLGQQYGGKAQRIDSSLGTLVEIQLDVLRHLITTTAVYHSSLDAPGWAPECLLCDDDGFQTCRPHLVRATRVTIRCVNSWRLWRARSCFVLVLSCSLNRFISSAIREVNWDRNAVEFRKSVKTYVPER